MRRSFVAAAAAVMLLGALIPAQALAGTIWGPPDQSAEPGPSYFNDTTPNSTQTVTPAMNGALTLVELYCRAGFQESGPVDVTVTVDSISASGTCPMDPEWVGFEFHGPNPAVVKDQQFTMDIGIASGDAVGLYIANDNYPGGQGISGDTNVGDFAFRTYVLPSPTATYEWSKTSVVAGSSTSVNLTAITDFPAIAEESVLPDAGYPIKYTVQLGTLPAWFTPTGITCSSQIDPVDCTLAKFKAGLVVTLNGEAATVTIVVAGTASPPLGSSAGAATGSGCTSAGEGSAISACFDAEGDLAVVDPAATPTPTAPPTAAPTPPPTTAVTRQDSMSGPLQWFFAAGLCFLLGSLFVARRRQAVRVGKS